MRYSILSTVAQLGLILVTVTFSLSPVILAAVLSGQAQGFGGVL